jgi:hypothetical protein
MDDRAAWLVERLSCKSLERRDKFGLTAITLAVRNRLRLTVEALCARSTRPRDFLNARGQCLHLDIRDAHTSTTDLICREFPTGMSTEADEFACQSSLQKATYYVRRIYAPAASALVCQARGTSGYTVLPRELASVVCAYGDLPNAPAATMLSPALSPPLVATAARSRPATRASCLQTRVTRLTVESAVIGPTVAGHKRSRGRGGGSTPGTIKPQIAPPCKAKRKRART